MPVAAYALVATYSVVLFMVVYFCICADPQQSPTAKFLTITLPKLFWETLAKVLGQKAFDAVEYVLDRALLLFYCVMVYGSWSIIFAYVYPWVGQQEYLSQYHRIIGIIVFATCVISWHTAHTASPGLITAETIARYNHFPYDDLLFEAGKVCPTRNIPKLARSKFDRFKYHENIPRFDHFCGWVHNTIGEENYRFFLLFLLVHVFVSVPSCLWMKDSSHTVVKMCWYGSFTVATLFYGEILEKELLTVTFFDRFTGEEVETSNWILFQYLFQSHFAAASVWIIMFAMSIALSLFLFYHVWLTSRGLTTNESYKWDAILKWHRTQLKRYRDNPTKEDDPGPIPTNLYHQGFVENWKEVIFPKSLRTPRRKEE